MCLGMNCCEKVEPQTEDSRKSNKVILVLIVLEICVAMAKMFVQQDVMSGIMELFLILILFMAQQQLNYCSCIMYIIFGMFFEIQILVAIATIIQNGHSMFPGTSTTKEIGYTTQGMILSFFLIAFYTTAIYFVFQAYKAYKWETLQNLQGGGAGAGQPILRQSYNNDGYGTQQQNPYGGGRAGAGGRQNQPQQQQQSGGFRAFQGQGVTIG